MVAVVASLGGLDALSVVLGALPASFPVPVVVLQHVPDDGASQLAVILERATALAVRWAEPGLALHAGTAYVAAPGYHLLVSPSLRCRVSARAPVSHARPSADVLLTSLAQSFGSHALGVVLTGRLRDGAAGAAALRAAGGLVIAQDPATSRAPGMPSAAIAAGGVDLVLPLGAIGGAIVDLVGVR